MSLTTLDHTAKRQPYGTLGQAIKHYRKKNKLSQAKLGELIGVCQSAIAHYESGLRVPSLKAIQELSEALHVPIQLLASHKLNLR